MGDNQKNSHDNIQRQGKEKIEQLKAFVHQSNYIDLLEQPKICERFGLPYLVSIFRNEYKRRVFNYLKEHITTAAKVTIDTGIPHKYVCQIKKKLEKKGLLKVVAFGICQATGSSNVQFLSTNPDVWNNPELHIKTNQLSLFY